MPKAERSEARDKAFEIWRASKGKMPLVGIAELLDVPAVKVRKWKYEDDWEAKIGKRPAKRTTTKKKKSRSPTKKKSVAKKAEKKSAIFGNKNFSDGEKPPSKKSAETSGEQTKNCTDGEKVKEHGNRTAQLGNKNAVGHGAPKRNRNAVKTGEYQTVYQDALTDEERAVYESAQTDIMAALDEEIRIQAVRKFRMEKLYRQMAEREEDLDTMDIYEYKERDIVVNVVDETGEPQETVIKKRQKLPAKRVETRKTMDDKMLAATQAAVRVDRQRLSTLIEKAKLEQGKKALELKERKLNAEDW